jgi:hypothetical protein
MGFVLVKLQPLADLKNSHWPTFTLAPASPPGRMPSTWCFASDAKACGAMPACTKSSS